MNDYPPPPIHPERLSPAVQAEHIVRQLAATPPMLPPGHAAGCALCGMPAKVVSCHRGVLLEFSHASNCPQELAREWVEERRMSEAKGRAADALAQLRAAVARHNSEHPVKVAFDFDYLSRILGLGRAHPPSD